MTDPKAPLLHRIPILATAATLVLAGIGIWVLATRDRPAPDRPTAAAAVTAVTEGSPAPTVPETAVETTTSTATIADPTTAPATSTAGVTTTAGTPTTTTDPVPNAPATTMAAETTTSTATIASTSTVTTAPVEEPALPVVPNVPEPRAEEETLESDCHIHGDAVTEACHPHEFPSTTAPDPSASGDCPGNYHQWFKVRDECVLDEVRKEFLAYRAGTHAQRMAAIRDGHLLERVFTESQASAEQYFGKEAANDLSAWTSVYTDIDNRSTRLVELYGAQWIDRDRINVLIRTVMRDGSFAWGWNVVPFTYVDGQWKISYQGFCRFIDTAIPFVEGHGGTLSPCPPDPRPDLVALEHIHAAYDPTDDPTRTQVNLTPGW